MFGYRARRNGGLQAYTRAGRVYVSRSETDLWFTRDVKQSQIVDTDQSGINQWKRNNIPQRTIG